MITYILLTITILVILLALYIVSMVHITIDIATRIYPKKPRHEIFQTTKVLIQHSTAGMWSIRKKFHKNRYGAPEWVIAEYELEKVIDRVATSIEMPGTNPYVEMLSSLLPTKYPEISYLPPVTPTRSKFVQEVLQSSIMTNMIILGPIGKPDCDPRLIISTICRIIIRSGKQTVITNESKYVNYYFGIYRKSNEKIHTNRIK